MDASEALTFIDQRLYAKTGEHLSDRQRDVIFGTWHGQTYRKISPDNPEYLEKTVAYRLWRKLSNIFDERVTKPRLRGIVERAWQNRRHVFISYRRQNPDQAIATTLKEGLGSFGYEPFINDLDATISVSLAEKEDTQETIANTLYLCDCYILLLSPMTAVSEMAVEQLRQLQQVVNRRGTVPPQLVAIWLEPATLSHDLKNYLADAYHWPWQIGSDPAVSLQRLNAIVERNPDDLSDLTFENLIFEKSAESGEAKGDKANASPTEQTALASTFTHPLPAAEPEIPQGQVRLESRFYVERPPQEALCYEEIGRAGALIRIKAPRQMGKTSLMARILRRAEDRGYRAIPVSFQHADKDTFANLGSLLKWFCAIVARRLNMPHRLEQYWDDIFGSKGNCTSYFKEYLLPAIESPLVLGLDEVDKVFQYPNVADDFFGMLRAWYEEGSYGSSDSELWERLRLVIVHSTEVYLPLDVNQSPFNVGLPIELPEFTPEQVSDLVDRHGLKLSNGEVEALMSLVGGHPYLIKLALYHLAQDRITLSELCESGPTEASIYGDHLRRHLLALKQNAELAEAYRAILAASAPIALDSERTFKLHSLGLVHLQGNGAAPSFELYRRYFSDRLNASQI